MLSDERIKRIKELEKRSFDRGIFTFSDFMSPSSLGEATSLLKKGWFSVCGGADFAERCIIRFGSEEEFGYSEDFPISILRLTLTGGKFASKITHRDVLGAVLNLGIERQKLGDIFINGNFAYVIVCQTVEKLIIEELKSVGRNNVVIEKVLALPDYLAPKQEQREFSVASNRADAILSKVYSLNREEASKAFASGFIAINGKIIETPSKSLKEGDVVTCRGFGKFVFLGEGGFSKKGKLYVTLSVYV